MNTGKSIYMDVYNLVELVKGRYNTHIQMRSKVMDCQLNTTMGPQMPKLCRIAVTFCNLIWIELVNLVTGTLKQIMESTSIVINVVILFSSVLKSFLTST